MDEKYTYLLVVSHVPTINQNHKLANHMYNLIDLLPKQLLMLNFYHTCLYTPKRVPLYFFRLLALALLLITLVQVLSFQVT